MAFYLCIGLLGFVAVLLAILLAQDCKLRDERHLVKALDELIEANNGVIEAQRQGIQLRDEGIQLRDDQIKLLTDQIGLLFVHGLNSPTPDETSETQWLKEALSQLPPTEAEIEEAKVGLAKIATELRSVRNP